MYKVKLNLWNIRLSRLHEFVMFTRACTYVCLWARVPFNVKNSGNKFEERAPGVLYKYYSQVRSSVEEWAGGERSGGENWRDTNRNKIQRQILIRTVI